MSTSLSAIRSARLSPPRVAAMLCFALSLGISGPAATAAPAARQPVTAILGAMPVEVQLLQARLQNRKSITLLGRAFHTGTLSGRRVVVTCSGVGKVNAAVAAALLIGRFQPSEVIFTGVAGAIGPEVAPGDLVLGEKTVQHDYGFAGPKGFECQPTVDAVSGTKNPRSFQAPARLLQLAESAARQTTTWRRVPGAADGWRPRVFRGVVATGDVFVASPAKKGDLREQLHAEAVEMEGAAVAQVCWQAKVPCLVIRSISDKADGSATVDFEQFVGPASANSAALTVKMMGLLAASSQH